MGRWTIALSRAYACGYDWLMAGPERAMFAERRHALLSASAGRVLDIGAGTGANLPHYPAAAVSELVLLDPSPGMLRRASRKAAALGLQAQLVCLPAERLPFPGASFDTVVCTLCLCTVRQPAAVLSEARRVLRPGGRLLVLEHVRSADPRVAAWQDRLTPAWRLLNGGCNLNRRTTAAVEAAGFTFESAAESADPRVPLPVLRQILVGSARGGESADSSTRDEGPAPAAQQA